MTGIRVQEKTVHMVYPVYMVYMVCLADLFITEETKETI